MNKELIPFLISHNDEKICLITDYDKDSANKQALNEVSEAFDLDIEASPLNIVQVPLTRTFDGITAKQHIAECDNKVPQRIYDFA